MKRTPTMKLLSAAAALALTMTACSTDSGAPADPEDVSGTVVFWTYPLGEADSASWWKPYVEEFNKEYPNVEVEVVLQPFGNREDALTTAIAGNNAPDVVYFNPDFIPRYAEEDLLMPLDDLRDDWDDFVPSSLESMTWDDTLYGAPLLMQIQQPYCNTEALAAAKVECPTTWDEWREAAPKFKEAGYYAGEYNAVSTLNHGFYVYLWQAGGEVLSDDLQSAAFNSPAGVEALTFIKEMVDKDWVPKEPLTVLEPLEQSAVGRAEVGYVPGSQLISTRAVVDPDLIEVAPPMKHREQVASGSVGAWSIFETTEVPEAAKAWVRFLSEPAFIEEFNDFTGYLPPRESLNDMFADDPQIADGMEYLDTVRAGVMHPKAREIIDTIRPHIQSVLLEGVAPKDALAAAEKQVDDLLARG